MPVSRIIDLIREEHCVPALQASSREEAIQELAARFVESGAVDADDRDLLVETVREREDAATTGIANGVALPHPKDPFDVADFLDGVVIAVGLHADGIDFRAPDGEPVQIVFLVASPGKHEYLEVAKRIVALAMGGANPEKWRRVLRQSRDGAAIREVLEEAWEELAP